ncbi:OmpA/MotB domain protein [Runella slithyformis DSM 19594]|uniref:OmpA/MotB domain protein n=2 Tax=Runella TaxID=105 RepID=A0A7U3ZQL8_RUNSL|nr:OmpA/MotB domain protein [Runella slithyformis DSM 19594]
MEHMSRTFLFGLLCILSRVGWGQCITLKGTIKEAVSGPAVQANFSVRMNGTKQAVGKSTEQGTFSLLLPCSATALMVEKKGFRTLVIPITGNEGTAAFFVDLELYPVDKQTADRPYFQSEQQDLVLAGKDSTRSDRYAVRYFKLIDEQTKLPLKGEVCLLYTKTDVKKCLPISNSTKGEKVVFTQEDIVGVIVTVNGYQTYNGNLIIDRLDNQSSVYEIALSRMVSMIAFSINASNATPNSTVKLVDVGNKPVPLRMADETHGYARVTTGSDYRLGWYSGSLKKTAERVITQVKGLHLVSLTVTEPSPLPAARPPLSGTVAIPAARTILFSQSQYELSLSARQTLDSVAYWLKQNPEMKAQITGFTDNVGNPGLNKTLSEFRAKVTIHYLTARGVPDDRLVGRGLGDQSPAAPNDTEANKVRNRRVEIKLLPDSFTGLK